MATQGKGKTDDGFGDRIMVELVDPDGQPFTTGDIRTISSLLGAGYGFADKRLTYPMVAELLADQQPTGTVEAPGLNPTADGAASSGTPKTGAGK